MGLTLTLSLVIFNIAFLDIVFCLEKGKGRIILRFTPFSYFISLRNHRSDCENGIKFDSNSYALQLSPRSLHNSAFAFLSFFVISHTPNPTLLYPFNSSHINMSAFIAALPFSTTTSSNSFHSSLHTQLSHRRSWRISTSNPPNYSKCLTPIMSISPPPTPTTSTAMDVTIKSTPPAQKPPPGAFQAAVTLGAMKASQPAWKVLLLGIIAGAYIAIGALLALTVAGAVPALKVANIGLQKFLLGAVGLPAGLTMVCVAGGELFTGNTALITAALLARRTTFPKLLKNWFWSYIGNFIGSLAIVWLAIATTSVTGPSVAAAVGIAGVKTSMPFLAAFLKGVLCNWLVCLAVYMSNAATDFTGKFLAIWLPISSFVAMGFDHSVANMFLIPIGMKLGADVSTKQFLMANLLPVTLGNVFAGVVLVALVYYLAYGQQTAK